MGPFAFGFGTKVIDTRGYSYARTKDGLTSKFTAIVSDDTCVPVIIHRVTLTSAGNSFLSTGYNNIFPGIRDNTIFSPPPYCGKGKAEGANNTFNKPLPSFKVVHV
ncbi:ependymin-related protein 1-like [Haliotis rubra]|uniref:ependymin-related protein 1-like n=1 Tax=Haliotis rubra TaxID=36100 RepID=UPI001EE59163|nr:ependymin-related protein 1-like [Haliotis rubra]